MGRGAAVASLVGATLFWAGNYVLGVIAVGETDPFSLVFVRWALAAGPLLLIAHLAERPDWRTVLRRWPWILALSLTGLAGYNLFLYAALLWTDAFSASLINAFNPALILLAAAVFLGQRLTVRGVVGVLVALAGVLVVLTKGTLAGLEAFRLGPGELLMLGAIEVWTAYTIIGRRAPGLAPITSTALQAVVTMAASAPFVLVRGLHLPTSAAGHWSLAFIVVFPSVLAYVLWNRALEVIPPGRAGVFLNLITVFTALAAVLTGQGLALSAVVGGLLVIGGVALTSPRTPAVASASGRR